jgi:hypothetical protein
VHTVRIPVADESSCATTPSGERPFLLSSSSNQSVLIARTRTQSVIDRSSPYNIVETSTDIDDDDDSENNDLNGPSIADDDDDVLFTEPVQNIESLCAQTTMSPSSSITSGTDVYMDAVDILSDEQSNGKSGRFMHMQLCSLHMYLSSIDNLDGTLTPICYAPFSKEKIDSFSMNIHRIDKDVARCDRTYTYFTNVNNLKKLRNIMCT